MDRDFEGFTLEQLLVILPPGAVLVKEPAVAPWVPWRATFDAMGITADNSTPGGAVAGLLRMVYGIIADRAEVAS